MWAELGPLLLFIFADGQGIFGNIHVGSACFTLFSSFFCMGKSLEKKAKRFTAQARWQMHDIAELRLLEDAVTPYVLAMTCQPLRGEGCNLQYSIAAEAVGTIPSRHSACPR